MEEKWYTYEQIISMFKICKQTLNNWRKNGKIRYKKLTKKTFLYSLPEIKIIYKYMKENDTIKVLNKKLLKIDESLIPLVGKILKCPDDNDHYPLVQFQNHKNRISILECEKIESELIGHKIFITEDETYISIDDNTEYSGLRGKNVYVVDENEYSLFLEILNENETIVIEHLTKVKGSFKYNVYD